jgi:hypothetical protein
MAHRLTLNIQLRSWGEFRDYFLEARIAVRRASGIFVTISSCSIASRDWITLRQLGLS